MQTIALVDYGSGNLRSAERALLEAARLANRRREVRVTRDPAVVRRADKIVLPGQGAFAPAMAGLRAEAGLIEALAEAVRGRGAAFLGICVGLQLLAERGLEDGEHAGLGWLPGVCRRLDPGDGVLPHMGWNTVEPTRDHPVLGALSPPPGATGARRCYFAHSYIVAPTRAQDVAAVTTHGESFASAAAFDTVVGVQFHPEKSQAAGLALLARFVDWSP